MSVYLVTGTAGFIGAKITEQLLEAGHAVVGLDNLNDAGGDIRLKRHRLERLGVAGGREFGSGGRENPPGKSSNHAPDSSSQSSFSNSRPPALERSGAPAPGVFEFHKADITDAATLRAVFAGRKFDAVFHLAARPGVRASMEQPAACVAANVDGSLNVLEAMRETGARRLALASTSSLYAGAPPPFREDQPADAPRSPYAASKKAAEALAHAWHHLHGFDVAVLRYFTVYGPAGRPDMSVLRFIHAIAEGRELTLHGDGSQTRDWTYVDDIARGTIAAARKISGYEIINLGGGGFPSVQPSAPGASRQPVALNEVIAFLEAELGRAARRRHTPAHPADMPETLADISKAARLLGWSPQTDWRTGLRLTVAWYRENSSCLAGMDVS